MTESITSRNVPLLGQNFAKALMLSCMQKESKNMFVGTSWGVSTRLMGALVMTHSDDQGLVLPQFSADTSGYCFYKTNEQLEEIAAAVAVLMSDLKKLNVTVKFDDRTTQNQDLNSLNGELKGVPIRIAVGPKDLENGTLKWHEEIL
jgi:prolyl-tRNA synthetase